jgi:choline dehydrogenase-like flavoprotein
MMRVERVDVCVIGSGAGGAVVACDAASRGLSTLILERGPYVRSHEMSTNEIDMIPRLFKDGGMQLNTGLDFFILQGACVGGSTVVSNMVLMRPNDAIFGRWARLGAALDLAEMHASYDDIERLLGARMPKATARSKSTELFERGARTIGLEPKKMLKALGDCVACGNCNIGCSFGAKRSALTTFVQWAEDAGARVLADTGVTRIKLKGRGGAVDYVDAKTGPNGEKVRVFADKVVVAAGAIGSSALLLASGIRKNVGRRLSFNVGAMMVAEFDEPLDSFDADQMTTYIEKDGYLIEATHNPIMSAALTTPGWLEQHSSLMNRAQNLAYAGAMAGSESVGRVVMSRWTGHEETRFCATPRDMVTLREGLKTIARTFFAAGAKRVFLPTERFTALGGAAEVGIIDERIRVMRDVQCGSSHPQGGNAMSDNPEVGVVDTRFAVHGVEGLFVCDASVFPGSVDVNPMHTVMALAKVGARRILAA